MKQLFDKILISLSLIFIAGCSTSPEVAPSQNKALNSVSNSTMGKEKSYFMQNQLDFFLDEELAPVVAKDKGIQDKYMDKVEDKQTGEVTYIDRESDNFTLQEIFDKVNVYRKEKPANYEESHVEKVNALPVLGSTRKR